MSTYTVQTLGQLNSQPPQQSPFLVEQGILTPGGRLLIAGPPKVGKSLVAEHMALSLASGIPFLGRFRVDHPTRVLLLDRELSETSLYSRLATLCTWHPGYRAAANNLLIDHDHVIRLDQPDDKDTLLRLVTANQAEVVVLDTAYKFFGGDMENTSTVKKAFATLDEIIQETGCSFILTHHQRKSGRRINTADPEQVAGSFLWTGWPNATILLNFLNGVENPYDVLCTFAAFRDAAAPEPLELHRTKDSLGYTAITPVNVVVPPVPPTTRTTKKTANPFVNRRHRKRWSGDVGR